MEEARNAFKAGDVHLSEIAHQQRIQELKESPEKHKTGSGQFVKNIVFGGLDGIITTFAVVAAVAGADLPTDVVLVLGFSNLVGDGVSMGLGDYLSSKAEVEYAMSEREREQWEMDNAPDGEKAEMVEIYQQAGFSQEDATLIIDTMAKNKKFFVDHMMVQELGIMVPDPDDQLWLEGLVMFGSFCLFGFVPLLAYLFTDDKDVAFGTALGLTGATLFVLGLVKARINSANYLIAGLTTLLNGALAAAAAYFIGWGIASITDVNDECAG
jgi:VIT1/CCC1 family predicted Fe2+/Mn2+ transporter